MIHASSTSNEFIRSTYILILNIFKRPFSTTDEKQAGFYAAFKSDRE